MPNSSLWRRMKVLAPASTRPIRGVALFLLLLASYYSLNPFSGAHSPNPPSTSSDGASKSLFSWSAPEESLGTASKNKGTDVATQGGGPRVRQASMIYETDKFNTVYERSVDSHRKHGEQWGIPTDVLRHDILDGFFNKPAYLLGIIINEMAKPYGQRADWIVWFDADTILLNPSVPWTLFLPPSDFDGIHILGSRDYNGFNAGMLMVRVHEWSVKMLSEVIALRQFEPHVELPFFDQSAIQWVFERPGYVEHFLYQPHNWWNSFGLQGEPYPTPAFILHFAGVDCCGAKESKGTIMARWLDKLESTPGEYNVPLENTTLPSEVSDYWAALTKARKTLEKADAWSKENQYNGKDMQTARVELRQAIRDDADNSTKVNAGVEMMENIMSLERDQQSHDRDSAI
ncbi:MAG: hypothetical protein Q9217_006093 [Psora testacea]